jgi:histidine triad (HIT) family protein
MGGCIFCKIVKGEVPSDKVYESDGIVAFNDVKPAAPIHVLIVPKKHIRNLSEATLGDADLIGRMNLAATEIARKLGIGEQFKLTANNGELAGQVVMHLHYHLLGGWKSAAEVVSEIHK